MNQRTHRRRTFHGIGQPDVEREHGALTGTAHEHQPQCPRQHQCALHKVLLGRRKGERTHIITVNQDTDEESEVGKTCHRDRVEQDAHVDMQAGRERQPYKIIRYQGPKRPVGQTRQGEITVCHGITQHGHSPQ